MNSLVLLVARILLSFMFIMAGIQKFGDIAGTAGYITSVNLPAPEILAWLSAIFETVGGIAILVGFMTRPLAWLFAIFCAFLGIWFHYVPADMMQMMIFSKDLTIAGGFLALAVAGAGSFSVDGVRGRA
jgi:putative oxidoreductase